MRYEFCTYFDKNYLLLGLTLHRSLKRFCPDFRLYVLCLDDTAFKLLQRIDDASLVPIRLAELEAWDEGLPIAKSNRKLIEYYFTLTPSICLYVLDRFGMDVVTYVDADVYFYSSPAAIYEELGDGSILATEHRFSERLLKYAEYGRFNVQYESFRADGQGLACLRRWREQCQACCTDRLQDGKYADQKYLDEWPGLYDRLVISQLPGVGLASWNIEGRRIEQVDGKVMVDGEPLIFYHFHGFKYLGGRLCKTGLGVVDVASPRQAKRCIFPPYVAELRSIRKFLDDEMGYRISLMDQRGSWLRYLLSGVKYRDLYYASDA